jgi:hypothetical protein
VTTLKLPKPLFETISLNISSINGVKLIAEQFQVQDDEIEIPLYQYQLPEGLYFVSVIGKSIQTNCLLIQQ